MTRDRDPGLAKLVSGGEQQAQRAESTSLVQRMARAGLAARAVVWAVLAYLTLDIAVSGAPGKSASAGGALQQVAREPADQAVLVVLAAGMIAYAAWRLLQAVAGSVGAENAVVRLFQRIGLVAAGVVYVALCVQALRLVVRGPTSPQSNHSSASLSAVVLGWPGGQELLAAIGLGIVIGSLIFTGWAAFQGFTGGLRMRAMPGSVSAFARVVGTAGQMMRGLVFIAVGTYVLIAAIRDAPGQTKGLDMTLRALDAKPYGSWLLVLAGAGFLAFALFSLVEVPYGRA